MIEVVDDTGCGAEHLRCCAPGGGSASASSLASSAIHRHDSDERRFTISESSSPSAQLTLTLYVESDCSSCAGAIEVATRVRDEFPQINVDVVDLGLTSKQQPDEVFAVPTFLLDGEVVSLGTPSWERLLPLLEAATTGFRVS